MAYCKNCGSEIDDKADICLKCGVSQKPTVNDTGGFGWGLLGFCIPIVGLILYLVWKDDQPMNAKSAGTGALTSVIVWVVGYVFMILALMI